MKLKIISILLLTATCTIYKAESRDPVKKGEPIESSNKYPVEKNSKDLFSSERNNSHSDDIETLSRDNGHSGGYGAISFKGSKFKDVSILMMGVRGAWIVNRSFGLGIDLNGILPVSKYDDVDPYGMAKGILIGGYGGFLLEPIIWSNKIVHITFPVSMGTGWLGYIEDWEHNEYNYNGDLFDEDVFWYIEPGVYAEFNISRCFRVDAGISKRFSQDLNLYNTPTDAFDKLNYNLTLKFGGF
jgi:hypothetical protein